MEPEVIKVLLGSGVGGGISAVFAYMLFKAYSQRVESLDRRSEACEADRIEMRKELIEIQKDIIADTREALNRSSAILEQFAAMAEKRGFSIKFDE